MVKGLTNPELTLYAGNPSASTLQTMKTHMNRLKKWLALSA